MNCSECVYHTTIIGSSHLSCNHPEARSGEGMLLSYFRQRDGKSNIDVLGIVINEIGLKNGWAFFPWNFDQIWIDSCNGFQMIGENNDNNIIS